MSSGVSPRSFATSTIGRGFTLVAISMSEGTLSGTIRSSPSGVLHEAPPEPALDAQVAQSDAIVERRRGVDDLAVPYVKGKGAADAAIRTNRIGRRLARLVPVPALAQLVLAHRHQRARRADGDAVAAVDACRVRQRDGELGRNMRAETAAGHRDRESVLVVGPARLDAFVAEHALA